MLKKVSRELSQKISIYLLLLAGTLSWSLTMVKSGLTYPFGIGFWGANGHDGVWHISLSRSLSPALQMPIFSGETVKNYHIGFDLLLNVLTNLTKIPVSTFYFQILPPILAFIVGTLVYKIVLVWKNQKAALWSLFFVYFGGSFGWLITLLRSGVFGGESMFWSQQAVSTLINPPFAFSLVMMNAGIFYLLALKHPEKFFSKNKFLANRKFLYFGAVVSFGGLIIVKVYAGILALGALAVAALFDYLKEKNTTVLRVFIMSFILSFVIFIPLLGSSKLIIFKPFWFLQTMVGLQDRFYWPKMESAIINYTLADNYFKLSLAYLITFFIFILGNFGTRVIGLWYVIKTGFKNLTFLNVFFYCVIGAGTVIPMLFLQTGTPWNTIQFFYYSLFFASILAGVAAVNSKKYIGFLIVALTIPTTITTLKNDYLPSRPPAMISSHELAALKFLEGQPHGVILAYNFDNYKALEAQSNPPRPLSMYASTAYVSAYSGKPIFIEDEINLDITGYDWRARREKVSEFVSETDSAKAKTFLQGANIKYLYLVKKLSPLAGEYFKSGPSQIGAKVVFENQEVIIYEII